MLSIVTRILSEYYAPVASPQIPGYVYPTQTMMPMQQPIIVQPQPMQRIVTQPVQKVITQQPQIVSKPTSISGVTQQPTPSANRIVPHNSIRPPAGIPTKVTNQTGTGNQLTQQTGTGTGTQNTQSIASKLIKKSSNEMSGAQHAGAAAQAASESAGKFAGGVTKAIGNLAHENPGMAGVAAGVLGALGAKKLLARRNQ